MSFLTNLPKPEIIENINYEATKQDIVDKFRAQFPDYELLESDPYISVLEAIAYRKVLLKNRINDSIYSMLINYATGADLDNLAALYGVARLQGTKPQAQVNFSLTIALSTDVTIPAGTIFRSDRGDISTLKSSVTIPAGETTAFGILILEEYTKQSAVKTEYIQNPLPFVIKASQPDSYIGGAPVESDDAFRERAILSLDRFSTAGSVQAYKYYTLTANAKIEEAAVTTPAAGTVKVFIKVSDDADVKADVLAALNADKVRPLTDLVEVDMAEQQELKVEATLELLDISRQAEIDAKIRASTKRFALGEDVNLSYLYKTLHQEGVYRVILTNPDADKIAADNKFYEITEWRLTYQEATW
ncbi:MAG: baseplate J/gp47 family protein [Campylobacteraceae bacterium]|jgi:phage-related baseplate assembly protein|nr:baseplate J/gp47 family protein [Campylobacteraceae bacterium]